MSEDCYGLWDTKHAAWMGLGLGPSFTPLQAATATELHARVSDPEKIEVRPLSQDNLIAGLPYPEAAKVRARVAVENGLLMVRMDPSLPWEPAVFRSATMIGQPALPPSGSPA